MSAEEHTERVAEEIRAFHRFLVELFHGAHQDADTAVEEEFERRFAAGFHYITPEGQRLDRATLAQKLRQGFGKNPDFEIEILDVAVHQRFAEHVIATYVELQKGARNSAHPENTRLSSVVLREVDDRSYRWLHLHETGLDGT